MRRICAILAVLLAMAGLPALAGTENAVMNRETRFYRAFTDGGTLYAHTPGALWTWRPGDAALTERAYRLPDDVQAASEVTVLPFPDDGRLCAVALVRRRAGEGMELDRAVLMAGELNGDGDVALEAVCEVDWSELTGWFLGEEVISEPSCLLGAGDRAVMCWEDMNLERHAAAIDLESGRVRVIDDLEGCLALTAYKGGAALAALPDRADPERMKLAAYDFATNEVTPLGGLHTGSGAPPRGIAYDPLTDAIYCATDGEVRRADPDTGELGERAADVPMQGGLDAWAGCVMDGGLYVYCGQGIAVRSLAGGADYESELSVCDPTDNTAVLDAVARFGEERPNVRIALIPDEEAVQRLVEDMVRHEDGVDVYVVDMDSAAWDAVHGRGYQLPLDGDALEALAGEMYPGLREQLSADDGRLVGVPVSVSGYAMSVNGAALAALGLTPSDIPGDWSGFLDFMSGLAGPLAGNPELALFSSPYTVEEARRELLTAMIGDYRRAMGGTGCFEYDTDALRGLLDRLERLDLAALGCFEYPEDVDEDAFDEREGLFSFRYDYAFNGLGRNEIPLLLSPTAGAPARMVLSARAAFVNPFTPNPDAALAFMNALADSLPEQVRYAVGPGRAEPVRGALYEAQIEGYRQTADALRATLEAADARDRQMIGDELRAAEERLADAEQNGWAISPESLAWYREHDDGIAFESVNWLNADGKETELLEQYLQAAVSAGELLRELDRKQRMMALEGS